MAKKDPELSTFRIGDLKRPEVRSLNRPQKSGASEPAAPAASVGFPAIEARLERGSVEALAEELRPTYEALEALSQKSDMKAKAAARKAMAAYERTADLFEYLFETKNSLQG